jgi:4-hydroxy-tetrahydrodipicolinate synthase
MFSGSIPALVTPFRDGTIDEAAFRAFVDWQIADGSSALVPCGTTGESATMTVEEHNRVIAICVDQAAGRVPVIAGCGSNDTRIALDHMYAAQGAGADAALVVAPYYNKPNQDGVYRHFAWLAERCDLPIILYNVPSRTITDIGVPVIHRLSEEFQTIVGIKDATGNLGRVTAQRLACRPDFCQLSGNDETALGFNAMGGKGCISVNANVAPRQCAAFPAPMARHDWDGALALQDRLYPLHDALFSDSSPGPVKYALTRVRPDMPGDVRLPITWPSESSRAAVDPALEIAGLV